MKAKRALRRIISLMLLITMLLPTNVYAVEPNKDNSNGSDSGHVGEADKEAGRIAASCGKTGWLIYVAKKPPKGSGKEATVVGNKAAYARATAQDSANPTKYELKYLKTRLKDEQGKHVVPDFGKKVNGKTTWFEVAKWGTPFDGNQKSRASAIKNEILNKDKTHYYSSDHDISNVVYIIKHYLGQSVLNEYLADPNNHYLILEPCAMHTGYTLKNDTYTKIDDYVASAYGWGCFYQYYYEKGKNSQKYGDGHNGWCDNCCLPRSCYLDENWPGLPAAPTSKQLGSAGWGVNSITYTTLTSFVGLGMMAYKSNLQTTCNETLTVPHQPANEANGDYQIVKNYVIKNGDGTYESVKCTSKLNSFEAIKIEREKKYNGYKLISYAVTTKKFAIPKKENGEDDYHPQDRLKNIIDKKGKLVWVDKVRATGDLKLSVSAMGDGEVAEEVLHMGELKGGRTVFLLLIKEDDDAQTQTTCDEKQKEPHQPPNESKGTYTIIKNYVDKTGDTYKSKNARAKRIHLQ